MTEAGVFEIALAEPLAGEALLLAPAPPETTHQTVVDTIILRAESLGPITATDGVREAYLLRAPAGARPVLRYGFDPSGAGLPAAAFASFGSGFEALSAELAAQITGNGPPAEPEGLLQSIADRFTYGHRGTHLGTGEAALPAFGAGQTTGSCVDIHSVCVAALRAAGVPAAYVIGGWVREGDADRPTGHCWIALDAPGVARDWDVSHHLEFGLGPVRPGLNPEPGRRFALSFGRAPCFRIDDALVEVLPALSGFHWASGPDAGRKLRTIGRFL